MFMPFRRATMARMPQPMQPQNPAQQGLLGTAMPMGMPPAAQPMPAQQNGMGQPPQLNPFLQNLASQNPGQPISPQMIQQAQQQALGMQPSQAPIAGGLQGVGASMYGSGAAQMQTPMAQPMQPPVNPNRPSWATQGTPYSANDPMSFVRWLNRNR